MLIEFFLFKSIYNIFEFELLEMLFALALLRFLVNGGDEGLPCGVRAPWCYGRVRPGGWAAESNPLPNLPQKRWWFSFLKSLLPTFSRSLLFFHFLFLFYSFFDHLWFIHSSSNGDWKKKKEMISQKRVYLFCGSEWSGFWGKKKVSELFRLLLL